MNFEALSTISIKFTNDLHVLTKQLAISSLVFENTMGIIDIELFKSRELIIRQLSIVIASITEIKQSAEIMLNKAQEVHANEIATVDELLNKKKTDVDNNGWAEVSRKNPRKLKLAPSESSNLPAKSYIRAVVPPSLGLKSALAHITPYTNTQSNILAYNGSQNALANTYSGTLTVQQSGAKLSKIKITEALFLDAIRVPSFASVKQDGELYYIDIIDHFAIILGGQLFHGNIGIIYTEEKNPEKIKDCKFASNCVKQDKCDYYHDPIKFSGSIDHRNYIASSFLYAAPAYYRTHPRGRRYGSREHLDTDIMNLQEEEISRFNDQTMHDILCALVLSRARNPS